MSDPVFCVIWSASLLAHIIIVQFGGEFPLSFPFSGMTLKIILECSGIWFATASLTLEQWALCLLLGAFELVLHQVSLLSS